MRDLGGLAEGLLGVRRIPQITLEVGDRRAGDDIGIDVVGMQVLRGAQIGIHRALAVRRDEDVGARGRRDRKSTRLNSSHTVISYAVFCLKKKNLQHTEETHLKTAPAQEKQHTTPEPAPTPDQ